MDRINCHRALGALLKRELDDTARFLACLGEEERALGDRQVEAIEFAARSKQDHLSHIEQCARERIALTQQAGFAPDRDGVLAMLHWCDSDGSLSRDWERLLDQARQCRDQNLINGALIEASRRQVRQALGILRGCGNDDGVYNPHGGSASGYDTRSLAKA